MFKDIMGSYYDGFMGYSLIWSKKRRRIKRRFINLPKFPLNYHRVRKYRSIRNRRKRKKRRIFTNWARSSSSLSNYTWGSLSI